MEAANRKQVEAELLHRRAGTAFKCFDVCIAAGDEQDIETWQVLARRAINGDEAELAEIEELLRPEPEPVEAPPVPQQRVTTRKRRRRKQNVVDFPGGR